MQTRDADEIVEALHQKGWELWMFTEGRHWVARIAKDNGAGGPYEVDFDRSASSDARRELAALNILAGFAGISSKHHSDVTAQLHH